MSGKPLYDWPSDEELVKLLTEMGSQSAVARWMGCSRSALEHHINAHDLNDQINAAKKRKPPGGNAPSTDASADPAGLQVEGDTATLTTPATPRSKLGDIAQLIKERGLDPDEWVVVSTSLNEWDAMAAVKRGDEPKLVRMRQWKVTLKRAPHLVLAAPARHIPKLRSKVGAPTSDKPTTIVVEGDHQVPYHDQELHQASLAALRDLNRKHRLSTHVFLGDLLDLPSISRFDDHPAAAAKVNECIQAGYNVLRDKREVAPNAEAFKLKGNHDFRLESELLKRAERMYGIKPAETEAGPELPALSLRRLLHLDKLAVELVEDPRGWQHAEVEVVGGTHGLVVRHGWLTGANTAEKSLRKRGRSIIVGHTHRREHCYVWDPSAECERQGVVAGTMSLVRNELYPHYMTLEGWLQGFVTVTRWPDNRFLIEHASWDGKRLTWRDYCWQA